MSWKWNTGPLTWKDKRSMCDQPLRMQGDGGIVTWIDSKHYHVSCPLGSVGSSQSGSGAGHASFRGFS